MTVLTQLAGAVLFLRPVLRCISLCLLLVLAIHSVGARAGVVEYSEEREPCRDHQPLMQPFFGDLHVHTRYSLDASTQGTRTTPAQSYEFAKGAKLDVQPWTETGGLRSLQLSRPLDFSMVSDHAELIGEVHMCNTPQVEGYGSWQCMLYRNWDRGAFYLFNFMSSMQAKHMGQCGEGGELCLRAAIVPWREMRDAAEHHYDRSSDCSFTTFVGYEWTGVHATTGGNLHRNVVFRNAEVPDLPISFIDAPGAEKLWDALDTQCVEKTGNCDTLVIPHNSNISAGRMFSGLRDNDEPMTREYAQRRNRFEPQLEVMQHKGASECYYDAVAGTDELCSFEQQPIDNIAGYPKAPAPNSGFARKALAQGMQLQQELGVNPYQFGVIASTDTHLGTPGAVEEDRFLGHGGAGMPAGKKVPEGLPDKLEFNPGGLAVLWAPENSRDALFDSLRRRETYATSGPRIVSRFFGGWTYPEELCSDKDRVTKAYAAGVPMGAELRAGGTLNTSKPTFMVAASQDPGTAESPGNALQRMQIIKTWITADGQQREKVIDVAGDAKNGASVDPKTCMTKGKGFAQLCTVWTDQEFQPDEQAAYYSRVVENPSCRWSQRICMANAVDCSKPETIGEGLEGCCAAQHQPIIQERAWSSPIWYVPAEKAQGG